MLLPSTFGCGDTIKPMRGLYTPSTTMLSPPPSHRQSAAAPTSLNISCRALQSLLTTNLPAPPTMTKTPHAGVPSLASPITLAPAPRPKPKKPLQPAPNRANINAQSPHTPPRTSKKRSHSDISNDDDALPTTPKTPTSNPTAPSTPKRQRIYPPTLPLGLSHSDFRALQETAASIPIPCTPEISTQENNEWCSEDDSALVSLILHKLQLRQEDWDECARKLGKGKDSIGERFQALMGSGEDGLRKVRGKGRRERGAVRAVEFGGPLPTISK